MAHKNTSVRINPEDEKRLSYIQAQLEKSTGLTISRSDVLLVSLREYERALKSKKKQDDDQSTSRTN